MLSASARGGTGPVFEKLPEERHDCAVIERAEASTTRVVATELTLSLALLAPWRWALIFRASVIDGLVMSDPPAPTGSEAKENMIVPFPPGGTDWSELSPEDVHTIAELLD